MWTDITELCKEASAELTHQRPMINIQDFSLHDAMSAVELMDPKMDQCYGVTCSIKTQDLLVAQFPDTFTHQAAMKIMQALMVQEAAFLDGASYLESTHQCIFMWDGSWESLSSRDCFSSRAILSFAKTLDRSLAQITKGVLAADIYEDEDYQPVSTTVLSDTQTDEDASASCSAVLAELESIPRGDGEYSEAIDKLRSLITCRKGLHLFYKAVGTWTHGAISMATRAKTNPSNPMQMDELRKSCAETKRTAEAALAVLSDLQDVFKFPKNAADANTVKNAKKTEIKTEKTETKSTANNGNSENTDKTVKKSTPRTTVIPHTLPVPADVDTEKNILEEHSLPGDFLGYKEHSEVLFAFSSILVKVLQPSAVRTIHLKCFSESIERIKNICTEVSNICDIFDRFTSPSAEPNFETLLHTAVELCADKMHLLSRSFFLGVLYTFLPSLPQLIVNSMKARGFPDVILTNPQVRDHWIKLSVSRIAWDTLKVLTVNRNRLLLKIDGLLGSWGNASSEAAYLDKIFQEAKTGQAQDGTVSDQLCTCWVMMTSTLLMDLQMGLTVENELLGMAEMAYFYWYWDYVCATRAWAMDKLRTVKHVLLVGKYETKREKMAVPAPVMDAEELVIRARGQMCRGLFRIFMAATDLNLFKPLVTTYTSIAWKFEQRFASFRSVPNPPVLTYEDFESTVSSGREGLSGANSQEGDSDPIIILANASLCFQNAKKFLSEIRRIEIEIENIEKLKGVTIDAGSDGTKTLDSGPCTSDSMRVAERQACASTMLLMKYTINSSLNVLKATQMMKTLLPPPVPTPPPTALSAAKNNKKTNNKTDKKTEKTGNSLSLADKISLQNAVYSSICMSVDFTKNSQYPLVEFKNA